MINYDVEIKKFHAVDIQALELRLKNISREHRNSIELYNSAIENLNNRSDDMAIIQLKKAIVMNDEFCEALTLLGLCYLRRGQKHRAADLFDRVLSIESDNEKVMEYRQEIKEFLSPYIKNRKKYKKNNEKKKENNKTKNADSKSSLKKKIDNKKKVKKINQENIFNKKNDEKSTTKKELITAVVIAVIISLIFGSFGTYVVYSTIIERDNNTKESDYDTKLKEKEDEIEDLQQNFDEITQYYEDLKRKNENNISFLEEADKTILFYQNKIKLLGIQDLIYNNKFIEAADKLTELKQAGFEGENKILFESMYTEAVNNAMIEYYNKGVECYDNKDSFGALDYFKKIIQYNQPFTNQKYLLYYTGMSNFKINEFEKSLENFSVILTEYPSFDRIDTVVYYEGKCFIALGRIDEAKNIYENFSEQYPLSAYNEYIIYRLEEIRQLEAE